MRLVQLLSIRLSWWWARMRPTRLRRRIDRLIDEAELP